MENDLGFLCYVPGGAAAKKVHPTYAEALTEATRLASLRSVGNVYILQPIEKIPMSKPHSEVKVVVKKKRLIKSEGSL